MPKVRCTGYWWFNRTLYKAGAELDVPEGTSVPRGFFVDGKEIPKLPRKSVVDATKDATIERLNTENAELRAQLKANQDKLAAPARSRKGDFL
jgi:hypothetical protein